jgi:hypothetical protein
MGQGTKIKRRLKKCKLMQFCKEYLYRLIQQWIRNKMASWIQIWINNSELPYGSKNPYFFINDSKKTESEKVNISIFVLINTKCEKSNDLLPV